MTWVHPVWIVALFGVALSGCLGGADETNQSAAPLQEETGSLAGRVLTTDHLPMRGVRVEVVDVGTVHSGIDGSWRVDNVTTGSVVIVASHPGHLNATEFATVRSGETTEVEVVMEPAPVDRVYHESMLFDARIACEVAIGTNADDTQWHSCAAEGVPDDPFRDFELDSDLVQIVAEAQWESTTPLADRLTFVVEDRSRELRFAAVQSSSPVKIPISPEVSTKFYFDQGGHVQVTIRAAPAQEDANVAGMGVAASQGVTFMLTAFYGEPAPSDFTALPG